jgi:cell shape-determining protein MreC
MKKIVSIVLSLMLMLVVCVSASAAQTKPSIDDLLAPYQSVINKVNADLGSSYFILDKSKEQVYNNIKNKTPEEFEAMLRQEYKANSLDPSYRTQQTPGYYTQDDGSGTLKTQWVTIDNTKQ